MAKEEPRSSRKSAFKWVIQIVIISFILTVLISLLSEVMMENVNFGIALIVVLVLVAIGITFDIIGVAVTSSQPTPYIAMAAKKVRGAKQCIWMLKNAEKVSNFCNDVIGDICGIVSGAAGAAIVVMLTSRAIDGEISWVSIIVSSVIAAVTIGGKAIGKNIAMTHAKQIVLFAGRVMSIFSKK